MSSTYIYISLRKKYGKYSMNVGSHYKYRMREEGKGLLYVGFPRGIL